MRAGYWIVALIAIVAGNARAAAAAEDNPLMPAHVVGVVDGDTIDVVITPETAERLGFRKRKTLLQLRIRVLGIDAPERGQAWSQRSKQALSDKVFDKDLIIVPTDWDRYERVTGDLYLPPASASCTLDQIWQALNTERDRPCDPEAYVNYDMVEEGHAWAYGRYADDGEVCDLESEARTAKRGLWSQPPATWIAPWDYRRRIREASAPRSAAECKAEVRKYSR